MSDTRAENRMYGHQKYGRCGTRDTGVAVEFQHLDIEKINRACDRFLEKRDPEYQKRKAYWAKEKKEVDSMP